MTEKLGALNCGTTICGLIFFFLCQAEKKNIQTFTLSIQTVCLNSQNQANENPSNVLTAC